MRKRTARWLFALAFGPALLAGCLPGAPTPGSPSPTAVMASDFPDPFVMKVGSTYYGYSTSSDHGIVPIIRSTDLVHWSWVGNGLTHVPSWADGPSVWAPSVVPRGSGYVMYYAANIHNTDTWCVSYATSSSPTGPFVDNTTAPLMCQLDQLGSGDPSTFVDSDGTAYLIWQSHGVPGVGPSMLWSAPLTLDGRGIVFWEAKVLLATADSWEGNVIENPGMIKAAGQYLLFYSANEWNQQSYATGLVRCGSALGPCWRMYSSAVLSSRGAMLGPGGPAPIAAPDGSPKLVFHAWTAPNVGYEKGGRRWLYTLPINTNSVDPTVG